MPSLFWNSEILNSWTLFLLKYILRLWTMDCLLYVQNSLRYQLWFLWKKADIKADIFYRRKNFPPLWLKHSSWFDSSTEDWGLVWGIPVTSLESLYFESISAHSHSLVLRALVMVLGCKEIQRDQSIGTWFCNMGFNVVFEVRKKDHLGAKRKFFVWYRHSTQLVQKSQSKGIQTYLMMRALKHPVALKSLVVAKFKLPPLLTLSQFVSPSSSPSAPSSCADWLSGESANQHFSLNLPFHSLPPTPPMYPLNLPSS